MKKAQTACDEYRRRLHPAEMDAMSHVLSILASPSLKDQIDVPHARGTKNT